MDCHLTMLEPTSALPQSSLAARTARVAALAGLPKLLEELEVEPEPLLAKAGLSTGSFADPDNRLPVETLARLLALCARASACPTFGLRLGQRVEPAALGPLVHILLQARSVERALRGLILNLHLNGEAVVPALTVTANAASLTLSLYAFHSAGADQLEDLTLAVAANVLRFLCGPGWSPATVSFAHRMPSDWQTYSRVFQASVQFNAERTALTFPVTLLSQPPHSQGRSALPASPSAALATSFRELDIGIRARRAIIAAMTQGDIRVDRVASLIGIGKRTLNRRLAEQGTSMRDLITGVRIQVAQQLMRDTDLPITDIAATTNYADSTSFSRAFREHTGKSPASWRKKAQGTR